MERRSSVVFAVGLVLLVLGLGNWVMGSAKLRQYGGQMAAAVAEGGPDVRRPFRGTQSILETRTRAYERYESANNKYQYYRIVYRAGRLLSVLGVILVTAALIRRLTVPRR